MFRSIRWRIIWAFILVIVIGMGTLGLYAVDFVRDYQTVELRSDIEKEARLVAEVARPVFASPDAPVRLDALAKTLGKQINARITVIAPDGKVLGDSEEDPIIMENHAGRPEVISALATGAGESIRFSTTIAQRLMYFAIRVDGGGKVLAVVRLAKPLTAVESSVNYLITTIASLMGMTVLLGIVFAILVARATTKPIKEVMKAANRLVSGELDRKVMVDSNDESGQLAHAFNEMALSLKKRIAAVSEEKSRLATILSTMADGVMMTDESGTIVLTNRAAENLFGFNTDRAIGLPVIQVIRDHEIDSALKACLRTGKGQTVQVDSGTAKRFLRAIAIPLSAENRLNGALLLFQDLTELRDLQTMRRELVSNVAHELRTPLAGIKAIVETLADGAIDDKLAAKDFLVRIDSEVDRLTQMVNELTDLSRIESGKTDLKLGPGHLKALVEGVVARLKPQAERQNLTISIELPPDLPIVPLDKGRIEQVVTNILHNAIKFTQSGGRIAISAKAEPDVVVVSIADTGMGISKEDLPHVYERFWKADRARSGGGTGLGLSIAKHIIQAHGGSIRVESEEGKGATFSFRLPL